MMMRCERWGGLTWDDARTTAPGRGRRGTRAALARLALQARINIPCQTTGVRVFTIGRRQYAARRRGLQGAGGVLVRSQCRINAASRVSKRLEAFPHGAYGHTMPRHARRTLPSTIHLLRQHRAGLNRWRWRQTSTPEAVQAEQGLLGFIRSVFRAACSPPLAPPLPHAHMHAQSPPAPCTARPRPAPVLRSQDRAQGARCTRGPGCPGLPAHDREQQQQ